MDDFKRCRLDERPAVAIFVVETVENAQPAEAAGACLRFYNRKRKAGEADFLRGKLRYAVLALGDTNLLLDRQTTTAKDCNQAGQTLDSALHFLGAERVVARCEANDAVGLEEAVEPWCESLWAPLADAMAAVDASTGGSNDASGAPRARVRFLFGSQTGNAAEICKAMAAEASSERGVDAVCCSMNETDVGDVLKPGNVVVYVVSSTGDGDAPDNCDAYFTRLKRAAKKEPGACGLGVQYAVLGLGDQNYSAFMAVPRSFTMAMEKAGAHAFYPRGEADDTLGLHEYCEKWQEGLWRPWRRRLREPRRSPRTRPRRPRRPRRRHQESERRDDVDRRRDAVDRRARRRSRASRVSRGGGVALGGLGRPPGVVPPRDARRLGRVHPRTSLPRRRLRARTSHEPRERSSGDSRGV